MEKTEMKLDFDALTGLITLTIGIVYGIMSYNLPRASIGNPMAPAMYPLMLAVTLGCLGICLFLKGSLKDSLSSLSQLKQNATESNKINWMMITKTCILCLLYAVIFNYVGYVISTMAFLFLMLCLINNGKQKWKVNIVISILFSIGIYLIFSRLLGIYLPQIPFIYI